MQSENKGARESSSVWPETLLARRPGQAALICEKQSAPSSPTPVVTFPRLEISLTGVYQTQCLRNGAVQDLSLRPATALFVPPGCWNSPKWQRNVRVLCLQFEQKRLTVNL